MTDKEVEFLNKAGFQIQYDETQRRLKLKNDKQRLVIYNHDDVYITKGSILAIDKGDTSLHIYESGGLFVLVK